jgi:hypothetical protein
VSPSVAARVVVAVVRRPSLWLTALRQWRRTTLPAWWRQWPFLPVPSGDYLRFRLLTQYGSAGGPVDPHDVVQFLVWCRRQDAVA